MTHPAGRQLTQKEIIPVLHRPLKFKQVRIENTNHCAYKCIMCPREKHTRPKGVMSLKDLSLVLDRVGTGASEIHLHGYGEPLLDNTLLEKVSMVKERCPESKIIFFSTFGVKLEEGYINRLAKSGIYAIRISCYGFSPSTYKAVHGVDMFKTVCGNLQRLFEARISAGKCFDIHAITTHETAWKDISPKEMRIRDTFIQWLRSAEVYLNDNFSPHNYGGGRNYNKTQSQRLCSIVWGKRREILQVTWDSKVVPCCFDYNSSVVFGDLRSQTLEEIFSNELYRKFIKAHQKNELSDYPVCLGCERCVTGSA